MSRILIVEDDQSLVKIIHENLVQKGFSVLEAGDGMKGLVIALRDHPDLVLLDIRMPRMDGMKMMHKLREDEWGKKVPIIILTNYDTNDSQLFQITADRPSYYLIKANTPLEKVVEKIQELLGEGVGDNKEENYS